MSSSPSIRENVLQGLMELDSWARQWPGPQAGADATHEFVRHRAEGRVGLGFWHLMSLIPAQARDGESPEREVFEWLLGTVATRDGGREGGPNLHFAVAVALTCLWEDGDGPATDPRLFGSLHHRLVEDMRGQMASLWLEPCSQPKSGKPGAPLVSRRPPLRDLVEGVLQRIAGDPDLRPRHAEVRNLLSSLLDTGRNPADELPAARAAVRFLLSGAGSKGPRHVALRTEDVKKMTDAGALPGSTVDEKWRQACLWLLALVQQVARLPFRALDFAVARVLSRSEPPGNPFATRAGWLVEHQICLSVVSVLTWMGSPPRIKGDNQLEVEPRVRGAWEILNTSLISVTDDAHLLFVETGGRGCYCWKSADVKQAPNKWVTCRHTHRLSAWRYDGLPGLQALPVFIQKAIKGFFGHIETGDADGGSRGPQTSSLGSGLLAAVLREHGLTLQLLKVATWRCDHGGKGRNGWAPSILSRRRCHCGAVFSPERNTLQGDTVYVVPREHGGRFFQARLSRCERHKPANHLVNPGPCVLNACGGTPGKGKIVHVQIPVGDAEPLVPLPLPLPLPLDVQGHPVLPSQLNPSLRKMREEMLLFDEDGPWPAVAWQAAVAHWVADQAPARFKDILRWPHEPFLDMVDHLDIESHWPGGGDPPSADEHELLRERYQPILCEVWLDILLELNGGGPQPGPAQGGVE